jgi:N-acetylglucosaminyldiphosphoundecaprenol N-acetyl-beta-D-mannosaminyltransferase
MDDLNRIITRAATDSRKIVGAHQNLHGVYLYHQEPDMRRLLDAADVIHFDSMLLVFAARLAGYPVVRSHRVTYADWAPGLFGLAQRERLRVFFLGGTPEVASASVSYMRDHYPEIEFEARHGYFDAAAGSADSRHRLRDISAFAPHVLLVGMGMPRQEIWTAAHLADIDANAVLLAGACFDYLVGAAVMPPRWLGQIGLEWLHRLLHEPRRLAVRYLVEPWVLAPRMLKDILGRARVRRGLVADEWGSDR